MWKWIGIVLLALFVAPTVIDVLIGIESPRGDSGLALWSLLAVVGVFFYQRRELRRLREKVDADLAWMRDQLGARPQPHEANSDAVSAPPRAAAASMAADQVAESSLPSPVAGVVPAAVKAEDAGVEPVLASAQSAAEPQPAEPAPPVVAVAPPTRVEVDERSVHVTSSLVASITAWFKGGNTIVRVAMLILFVGVGLLLRYAVERDMLPIELRLAAVAAGGVVVLLIGWRLRDRRRGYGLTLQGGGIGVLYMTLYAAMRLYGLVPPLLTLALMVAIAGLAALLALRQDSLPMAVVGSVGGLAAPLLTASSGGNHVLLFGYCLVLNVAIAWIAGHKAWKLLNLVGFIGTSLVAMAWGAVEWRSELLASTEPLLVAHLALYLYITVQYSRQLAFEPAPAGRPPVPYVDAGLVFGMPLVAAGLQAAMVRNVPYALAVSAAVMSAIYLLLGRWLWRRAGEHMRLLTEGMLALGATFLTLVAPLALDQRWTAAAWAVQGTGMVWVALRQRRAWALYFGLALQPLAALAFWSRSLTDEQTMFVANAQFFGVLLLAASALACARLLQREITAVAPTPPVALPFGRPSPWFSMLHWAALIVGLMHLLAGAYDELVRAPWSTPDHQQSLILWITLLALALEAVHRRLRWPELAFSARPLIGLAGLLSLSGVADAVRRDAGWSRLWPAGLAEVVILLVAAGWLLRRLDAAPAGGGPARGRHPGEAIGVAWYAMVQGALAVHATLLQFIGYEAGWAAGAVVVVPTSIAWLALSRVDGGRWPMNRDGLLWILWLALPWMAMLVVWSAVINLLGDGSMQPLPYLPLLNPVDLGHALMLLYALRLRRSIVARPGTPLSAQLQGTRLHLVAATAAVAFWWLTSVLVRSLYHWAGTPMWYAGALESGLVQTGLSILWTLCALATMFASARRVAADKARIVWLVGAALLAVVVVKLMLIDLSQTSALQRIVSFVGVGLLMLVVGYVTPIPPQPHVGAEKPT